MTDPVGHQTVSLAIQNGIQTDTLRRKKMTMKTIETNNPTDLPLAVFKSIFSGEKIIFGGTPVEVKQVSLSSGAGSIKKVKIGNFLYLEQNPYKDSKYGRLARAGHKIMWIIYEPTEDVPFHRYKPGSYIMKVENGKAERLPASY